ncbi:MAG: L-serine ammonia-lyase [Phyllobacteriaceae bacterium]|nr:L-serine ammonia-lyase [Phyllobacteriaceae bacterium]
MFLSVFDVFKIGIGPSSSHTMGPMTAANRFLDEIASGQWVGPAGARVTALKASLHGSLAYTGVGHATDRAVILGLAGHQPHAIDPDAMDGIVAEVHQNRCVTPHGHPAYGFDPATDLVFDKRNPLPGHANGMAFSGLDADRRVLLRRIYYSVGGGFIQSEEELQRAKVATSAPVMADVPFPFRNAAEMLAMASASGHSIAEMKRANEQTIRSRAELDTGLDALHDAMMACIDRGLAQEGVLPGGLKVKRRAKAIGDQLSGEWQSNRFNPMLANEWLGVYAMAVNEENAAGGRVVTAPTNGAAGDAPTLPGVGLHLSEGVVSCAAGIVVNTGVLNTGCMAAKRPGSILSRAME